MAFLSIPKNYSDGEAYLESDVDDIRDALLTFLNTTKLNSDNFQANTIDISQKMADGEITAAKLAAAAYDDTTITVSGGSLIVKDDGVTTSKIADDAVTYAKLEDTTVQTGTGGTATDASWTSFGEVSITTKGGPVMLNVVGTSGSQSSFDGSDISSGSFNQIAKHSYRFYRDSTVIGGVNLIQHCVNYAGSSAATSADLQVPPTGLWYIDEPDAGSYTYGIEYLDANDGRPQNLKLQAVEL